MKPSSPTPGEGFHPAAPAGEEGARTIGLGVYGETRLFPHRHGLLCPGIFYIRKAAPQGTDATGQNWSLGCPSADKPGAWPGWRSEGCWGGGSLGKPGGSALPGRSPQLTPLEGKPVSPETSQFYSECLNSFEKCKNQLRGGGASPGAPHSSRGWGGEMLVPCAFSLAQLHPPALLRPRGRVMLLPPPSRPRRKHTKILDPHSLRLPARSPRVKNL